MLYRPSLVSSTTRSPVRSLVQKLFGSEGFHPLTLNPYLLFDAETSMIGTLENPTLDLNPANPSSLDVITATRAGTATFTDANNNIATASSNTVRVDHSLGYPAILVEPSVTNILSYSEDFTNNVWKFSNSGTNTVGNSAVAPNGTTTADSIVEDTTTGAHRIYGYNPSWQVTAGTTYTFSVFVKANGRDTVRIDASSGISSSNFDLSALTPSSQTSQLGNGWVRCHLTGTASSSGVFSVVISPNPQAASGAGTYTGDGTSGVHVWGAQLEEGAKMSSYIPTSTSAAGRYADNLVIDGTDFSDFYNGSEGTFYLEIVDRQVTGSSHSYIVGQTTSQFFLYKDSAAQVISYDNTTGLNKSPLVADQLMRLALTYKSASPASRSLSLDGSTSDGFYNGNFSSANILKIGGGYTDVFSGHFKRILYWPNHSDSI